MSPQLPNVPRTPSRVDQKMLVEPCDRSGRCEGVSAASQLAARCLRPLWRARPVFEQPGLFTEQHPDAALKDSAWYTLLHLSRDEAEVK